MQAIEDLSIRRFERDGFLVVRGLVDEALRMRMHAAVNDALEPLQGPAEFESEVGYEGSPSSRTAVGGNTSRRLLNVYSRDVVFRQWARSAQIRAHLQAVMHASQIELSQCHHNCIMTKQPGFSSATMWHQDIRYWSFDRPELVSVWLALGEERENNGALQVISGSHHLRLDRGTLDRDLFLRQELPENRILIDGAQVVELDPGDVLFFHCRLFHAAGTNRTDKPKLSVVFTYHVGDNAPIPGTRSAQYPSIPLN